MLNDNPSFAEYRSLTEYDEKRNNSAKDFISKSKKFEELGLLKCIGNIAPMNSQLI